METLIYWCEPASIKEATFVCQESGGGWRKDEVRPLIGVLWVSFSALTLLVGWQDGHLLSAATRLVFSAGRSAHITPLFRELCWLEVPEWVQFHLCVLVYRCLHHSVPQYLAETLHNVVFITALRPHFLFRQHVESHSATAFPVSASRAWNALPAAIRTSSSYLAFWRDLKTFYVLRWLTSVT